MALMKAWQPIYIDKELPPPSKPSTVQKLFSQAGLEGSFQRMVENGKNQSKTTGWPIMAHLSLTPSCPVRDISRAAVNSITYQSLLQRSYFRIKLLHLKIFT